MSQSEHKYYPEINIARGIAVLCVIFGHSFPDLGQEISSPIAHYLVDLFYSFHMGLFFFLSGFVSSNKLIWGGYNLIYETKKKLWRLGVPYAFYSMLGLMIKTFGAKYSTIPFDIKNSWEILLGVSPNITMWFLWTLLIVSLMYLCVGAVLKKTSTKIKLGIYIFIGSILLGGVLCVSRSHY